MRPALSQNKTLRMLTLCGLYVAQGVPWGFVTITFAAWLAEDDQGLTTAEIGPIMAVASLPWSFKFLWGPIMDRFTVKRLGKRRPWIIFAQAMAILVLGSMAFFDDLPGMVWTETPDASIWKPLYWLVPGPLAALILLANMFVSIQDVAVDALAVDLLEEKERGIANGLMYGSSYFGTALGGAGLGYVVSQFGIQAGILGQAVILAVIMVLPVMFRERPHPDGIGQAPTKHSLPAATASADGSPFAAPAESATSPVAKESEQPPATVESGSLIRDLLRAFSLRATILGVFVALGVKIGIGVLTTVFVDYLMKDGGWTQEQYSTVTGGYAVLLGLAGSAIGGLLADRLGAKPVIATTSIVVGLMWIVFGLMPNSLSNKSLVTALLISQEFTFAVLSVGLFSLFMAVSWPRVAATQFTTYMALMNGSTAIGSYLAGVIGESMSIYQVLIMAGGLQIVMILPVLFIDPRQTRRILGHN
ncbi:MAG: MFS transporter [Planctomycetaceae bacterium]|nr:MFS transporter [Planctomycetaceae bacterium]